MKVCLEQLSIFIVLAQVFLRSLSGLSQVYYQLFLSALLVYLVGQTEPNIPRLVKTEKKYLEYLPDPPQVPGPAQVPQQVIPRYLGDASQSDHYGGVQLRHGGQVRSGIVRGSLNYLS